MTSESCYRCSVCHGLQCYQRGRLWWQEVDVTRCNNSSENVTTSWLCFSCQKEAWRDAQTEMKSERSGECNWMNEKEWQAQKAEEEKKEQAPEQDGMESGAA